MLSASLAPSSRPVVSAVHGSDVYDSSLSPGNCSHTFTTLVMATTPDWTDTANAEGGGHEGAGSERYSQAQSEARRTARSMGYTTRIQANDSK